MLVDAGAEYLSFHYKGSFAESVTFTYEGRNYQLPARWEGVKRVLEAERPRSTWTDMQCQRIAWRHIHDWLKAQIAMVQSGQVVMHEVMMPYEFIGNRTAFQIMESNRKALLLEAHDAQG